jgi:hypothetical protein
MAASHGTEEMQAAWRFHPSSLVVRHNLTVSLARHPLRVVTGLGPTHLSSSSTCKQLLTFMPTGFSIHRDIAATRPRMYAMNFKPLVLLLRVGRNRRLLSA